MAEIDLERDLPTTAGDVEALRRVRWAVPVDLDAPDASRLPFPPPPRRSIFPEAPPFEL